MDKIILFGAAIVIMVSINIGIACLFAWAVTSIWPSLPFWPIALGAWALAALFSKTSSKQS